MTPFGVPEAHPARGTLFGNRGCLVDAHGRLARPWRGERWISCVLAFKGRRRHPLMQPGRYTELFFWDEATALAAGHRPCAECRRADLEAFRAAWLALHPQDHAGLPALDRRLHAERTATTRPRVDCAALPDGAMVAIDGAAWLVRDGGLAAWSHAGYGPRRRFPAGGAELLTPPSSAAVLAAGWRPAGHALAV